MLSQDLTVDILSRLPVKTLTRFKSVSKDFNSIPDDPIFLKLHRLQSQKNPYSVATSFSVHTSTLFLNTSDPQRNRISFFRKQIPIDNKHNNPIGTCHSLHGNPITHLLPSNHHLVCIALGNNNIYICNPSLVSTKGDEFLRLPPSLVSTEVRSNLGFGYLPSKKQYKLVKLNCFEDDYNETSVEIFEMTTPSHHLRDFGSSPGIWRFLEERCPHVVKGDPVSTNGCLIWKIYEDFFLRRRGLSDEKILLFDLEKEKFEILTAPPSVIKNNSKFRLAGIRGELWLVEYIDDTMELWVLKDFGNRNLWMQKCKIDCTRKLSKKYSWDKYFDYYRMHPLDLRNDGKILFQVDSCRRGLGWYNPKYNMITDWFSNTDQDAFRFCFYTEGFLTN